MQCPEVVKGYVLERLTVTERDGIWAVCDCKCGTTGFRTRAQNIKAKSTKSCGCFKREVDREKTIKRNRANATHRMGHGQNLTYNNWYAMISRCTMPGSKSYNKYGAIGIVVCRFLKEDPRNLVATIGNRPAPYYTIDRFPIYNGNYTCGQCEECKTNSWPLNVRWATRKQQSENRGDFNVWLTIFGKTMLLSQWETASGINEETIRKRRRRGWTDEEAVTVPDSFGHRYQAG